MIFLSSVCQLVKCCSVCTDYVDTMKKLLFSLTDAERKEVLEKYSSKKRKKANLRDFGKLIVQGGVLLS